MVNGDGFDPNAARASAAVAASHHNDPETLWRHMASAYDPAGAMNEWVKAKESGNVPKGLEDAIAQNFKNNAARGVYSHVPYFSQLMDGDNWEKQSPSDKAYVMGIIRPPDNRSPLVKQQAAAFSARVNGLGQKYSG
jgi:hypothetical protein